jgi:hypothetical protein
VSGAIGSKLSAGADFVGNIAEKVAPIIGSINPEAGAFAATVGGIAKGVGTAGRVLTNIGNM